MKCPKCGSDVSGNFCINCGNKLILTPSQQSKKTTAKIILRWIIVGVLVVLSLGAVQTNVISFILILLSAFIVSPISDNVPFVRDILSRHKPLKIVLPILYCFIAFAIIDDKPETDVPKQTETAIVSTTVTTENTTITTTLHKTTTKKTTTKAAATTARITTTKAVVTTAKTADAKTSSKATVATVPTTTTQVVTQPTTEAQIKIIHFILNTDTNCVHILPSCSAAQKIVPENYSVIDIPENQLSNYSGTYWACGMCSSEYRGVLPKD